MAFNIHWQIPFRSYLGTDYVLSISEDGYEGSITTLTGADTPFETKEDADDNIFKAVRGQTATISFVTNDQSLIQNMMPENPTDKLVKLTTSGNIVWIGFLSEEVYSQPYDAARTKFTLNALSILKTLDNICLPSNGYGGNWSIIEMFKSAWNALGLNGISNRNVVFRTRISPVSDWYNSRFFTSLFYHTEENYVEDTTVIDITGDSYASVFGAALSMMGMSVREHGTEWIVSDVIDCEANRASVTFHSYNLNNDTTDTSGKNDIALSNYLQFIVGKKTRESIRARRGKAIVSLSISRESALSISLPPSPDGTENALGGQETLNADEERQSYMLYVIPHEPVVRSTMFKEIFTFRYHNTINRNDMTTFEQRASSYSAMKADNGFVFDMIAMHISTYPEGFTIAGNIGAFPCKWTEERMIDIDKTEMRSGLLLNIINALHVAELEQAQGLESASDEIYSIETLGSVDFSSGYITLSITGKPVSYYRRGFEAEWPPKIKVFCGQTEILTGPGKYHVTNRITGKLRVSIYSRTDYTGSSEPELRAFSYLLTGLLVAWTAGDETGIELSDRSQNNFINIINTSFSGEAKIRLSLGTRLPGNKPSVSFLMNSATTAFTNQFDIGTNRVPERYLLTCLTEYNSRKRKNIEAQLRLPSGNLYGNLDIYRAATYEEDANGNNWCRFTAYEKTHNWREDMVTLKFLEVQMTKTL